MPFNVSPKKGFIWFIIDGCFEWDEIGWFIALRTPIFMFSFGKRFERRFIFGRETAICFALFARQPGTWGEHMYFLSWTHRFSFMSYDSQKEFTS